MTKFVRAIAPRLAAATAALTLSLALIGQTVEMPNAASVSASTTSEIA
jgi:hypothetical protein